MLRILTWDNGSYPAMLGMLSETKLGPSVDNHQVPCVQWSSQSTMSLAWGWPHSTTKCQLLPPFLEVAINQACRHLAGVVDDLLAWKIWPKSMKNQF